MATINLEMIDKINQQLDGITDYIDEYMLVIEDDIKNAGDKAQVVANEKMELLSTNITQKLQPIREKIINIFKAQYQSGLEKIKPIEPLLNVSLSIDTVVSVVQSIINIIIAPYQPIIEFTTQVIPKVVELSNNMQRIANYQPNIPEIPNVEIPPLNVEIEPITPADITG